MYSYRLGTYAGILDLAVRFTWERQGDDTAWSSPAAWLSKRGIVRSAQILLFLIWGYQTGFSQPVSVVVNEILASNGNGLEDEFGDRDDWLELYNAGSQPVDLAGYYLSDDADLPTKWKFPSQSGNVTTIQAGRRLLIWTDGDPEQGPLHCEFRLSAAGEFVGLVAPDGSTVVDSLTYPAQQRDISFGRAPDGSTEWAFFDTPTPGNPNPNSGTSALVADSVFSLEPGFYDGPITVSLSTATRGARIFVTTDGSDPERNSSLRYNDPISITSTTVLRALAYKSGSIASYTVTGTFFIGVEHSLPVLSVAAHPDSLFHPKYGILVTGPNATCPGTPAECSDNRSANFWQDREPPGHVEYYDERGNLGFAQDIGVKTFGGVSSRWKPKKSIQILGREVRNNGRIDYPMFASKPDIESFDGFIVRSSTYDWARFRNEFIYEVNRLGGSKSHQQAYKYVILYLNGSYWGLYNLMERKSMDFIKSNFGEDNVDMLYAWSHVLEGNADEYNKLVKFMNSSTVPGPNGYREMERRMDLENFIEYWIHDIYLGNWDNGNVRYFRPRRPDTRWRWISYDNDKSEIESNTLLWVARNNKCEDLGTCAFEPLAKHYWLLGRALLNQEFRDRFVNRFSDLLNTILLPDSLEIVYDNLAAQIRPEIPQDLEKWGRTYWARPMDPVNKPRPIGVEGQCDVEAETWEWELCERYRHARLRPDIVRSHMVEYLGLRGTSDVTISVDVKSGGNLIEPPIQPAFRLNTIGFVGDSFNGVYFRGVPIQLELTTPRGFTVNSWGAASLESETVASFVPDKGSHTIKIVLTYDDEQARPVTINEINYNNPPGLKSGEWIELYNPHDDALDIGGWTISDASDSSAVTLPEDLTVPAKGYRILCSDQVAFTNVFSREGVLCEEILTFRLGNDGDHIRLWDNDGILIDQVQYQPNQPWPGNAGGSGATLELKSVDLDNNDPDSWRASSQWGGTPGGENKDTASSPPLVINEINYNSAETFDARDWIELYNPGENPVDVNGWRLIVAGLDRSSILTATLPLEADGYLTLCRDKQAFDETFAPTATSDTAPTCDEELETAFSNDGDRLWLLDQHRHVVDSLAYNDTAPWPKPADGLGYTLTLRDAALDNSLASSWVLSSRLGGSPGASNIPETDAPPLVINEIRYTGAASADSGDWIEVFNPLAQVVDLAGWTVASIEQGQQSLIATSAPVQPHGYLVMCSDPIAFGLAFKDSVQCVEALPFALAEHDHLVLYDRLLRPADSVHYGHDESWPEVNGTTASLELRHPRLDNTRGEHWIRSEALPGTPGLVNSSVAPATHVVINEINYHSADTTDAGDWIELFHRDEQSAELSNWLLSTGPNGSAVHLPPETTVEADTFEVLCASPTDFLSVHGPDVKCTAVAPLNLNDAGIQITLIDDVGRVVDVVAYDDESPWPLGANGQGYTLELWKPTVDNSIPGYWYSSFLSSGTPGRHNGNPASPLAGEDPLLPNEIELLNAYPNPFRTTTRIGFRLPAVHSIEIPISNIAGQTVWRYRPGVTPAGTHQIEFDGSQLGAGLYFYRLIIDGAVRETKSVLLIR